MRRLKAPDSHQALNLLGVVAGLRTALVETGAAPAAESAWFIPPTEIGALMGGQRGSVPTRIGVGAWEPFIYAVARAAGRQQPGTSAFAGTRTGLIWHITIREDERRPHPRMVLASPHPRPQIAPPIWDSAAMATTSGGVAAHVFDSDRALGMPAVCGVDLPAPETLAAVDGNAGLGCWLDRGRVG